MAEQEIANHIVEMVVQRMAQELQRVLIDEIPDDDLARVSQVKIGRFQEDPSQTYFRVSIQGGDLEKPDMLDEIVDPDSDDNRMGVQFYPREIGGTELWWRRGTIRIELFFIYQSNADEDLSRKRAYTILGRVQDAVPKIRVHDLRDDFGEHAIRLFRPKNAFFQSGGPPESYIWRGKLLWECLTEWEPS